MMSPQIGRVIASVFAAGWLATSVQGMRLEPPVEEGKIYWTDGRDRSLDLTIRRANLDGSNSEDLFTGPESLRDLAVDETEGKMYWTDENGIHRADLDGSNAEILLENLRFVRGIALDIPQPALATQTALLANFPNPFNPETWLPFQLHAPAPVRLSIYDVRGALIREIDLGYRAAGQYLTSTSAAHWDGRDQHGQRVASGVYLYRLQAGPVAHVRKMILIK